jgi:drug/metabolite transporter (DMT)-like permease
MTPANHRGHVPPKAIVLVVGAVLCYAVLDAAIKYLTRWYSTPFLVWSRYCVQATALMLWFGPALGRRMLVSNNVPLHAARGVLLAGSSLLFVTALRKLPLAETATINYTSPVLVVILAVLFLGERMTWQRTAFVATAMLGMLMIVRPGSGILADGAGYALASAATYATYQVLTRKLAADDARVSVFYPALVGMVLMTLGLPLYGLPETFTWLAAGLITGAGVLASLGHFLFIRAFQHAPASALTPFAYVQLVWVTLLGWLVFDNFPDAMTLAGMALITGSGLVMMWVERRRLLLAAEPPAVD